MPKREKYLVRLPRIPMASLEFEQHQKTTNEELPDNFGLDDDLEEKVG